ncbi:hypothetical protein [Hymenobacter sp. GOD-10R]|nr:hypothetical protein [Hymenobacter sp. GOD-10R]WRQ31136.1 hypothetical protein SD425_12790 [Hymenobacter sp. GOD-10R]
MHRSYFLLTGMTALLSLAACRPDADGRLLDPSRPKYVELTLTTML